MDLCEECEHRENIIACREESCDVRDSWLVQRMIEQLKDLKGCLNDAIVTKQAAVIAERVQDAEQGMIWIYNSLCGPGLIPDESAEWADDPDHWYSFHKSNPLGPCEVCGKPSGWTRGGHVACCEDHLDKIK